VELALGLPQRHEEAEPLKMVKVKVRETQVDRTTRL
jgi:hypothetical protein